MFAALKKTSDEVGGNRKQQRCKPCENDNKNTVGELFCMDCCEFLCEECSNIHKKFGFMSGHEIVEANKAKPPKPKMDMKGLDTCDKHNKQLEFFCVDHQILCCNTCAFAGHRKCQRVNEITIQAPTEKLSFQEARERLTRLRTLATDILQKTKDRKTGAAKGAEVEQLLEQIDQVKQSIMTRFDALKTKISNMVTVAKFSRYAELESSETTTGNILKEVEKFDQVLSSVDELGTDDQKFIAKHVIEQQTSSYTTEVEQQEASSYELCFSVKRSNVLESLLLTKEDLAILNIKKQPLGPSKVVWGSGPKRPASFRTRKNSSLNYFGY